MAVWAHPIVGSGAVPDAGPPLLAVAGSLAWLVGCVAAAVALRRGGSSWIPVALLVISGASFFVFRTHAWPGGPIAFGALGIAAAWNDCKSPA